MGNSEFGIRNGVLKAESGKRKAGFLWLRSLFVLACLVGFSMSVSRAQAQDPPGVAETATDDAPASNFLVQAIFGSLTGIVFSLVLLGVSLLTGALVIDQTLAIRGQNLMPNGLAERVQQNLLAGQVAHAEAECKQNPSFLAFVLQAGIGEVDGGWTAVEKAMEDAAAEQSARLFRKIEYLSLIGNIAPMVGLLGTVVGMIAAFWTIGSGNVDSKELGANISLALFTTAGGLLVAIPALTAFAVFRNRVDQFVAEASYMALHVFAPLKRRRAATQTQQRRGTPTPPTPPTPPAPPSEGGS